MAGSGPEWEELKVARELVVIALGGNAILQPGQRGTAEEQLGNVRATCRQIVMLLEQVVWADDPAFRRPTKPVGPFYDEEYARKKVAAGETWVEDAGRGWRKVVPSPDPVEIVELDAIRELVRDHAVVVCTGGGGIPVVREPDGTLRGVEAVIDKDLGGQRLATGLGADVFMILTDVPAVAVDYGKPTQRYLGRLTVGEARALQREGHFKPGSMGPKVEACCRFVEAGGRRAVIGSLTQALEALGGRAGTWIVPARELRGARRSV